MEIFLIYICLMFELSSWHSMPIYTFTCNAHLHIYIQGGKYINMEIFLIYICLMFELSSWHSMPIYTFTCNAHLHIYIQGPFTHLHSRPIYTLTFSCHQYVDSFTYGQCCIIFG